MAKISLFAILSVLSLAGWVSATISNLQITTPQSIYSGGNVGFSYSSNEDTVNTVIYIETEGNQTLDTTADRFFYRIIQIDNDTVSDFKDKLGYLADGNDTLGRYFWFIPQLDLPAGLYWVHFSDKTGAQVDSFRMLPVANPYRTISGNVTAPAGEQKSFIQVNADENNSRFSAFTDTLGDYTIMIDSASIVNSSDTVFRVQVDALFSGFMLNPSETRVDVRTVSVTNIDFTYDSITSGVRVTLLAGSIPMEGVGMGLSDSATNSNVSNGQSDSSGFSVLGAPAGVYWLNFDRDALGGYLFPDGIKVRVLNGAFADTTIDLILADTAIYGRLTKDGGNPGGNYRIDLRSDAGNSEAVPDINGYFRLSASTQATQTSVHFVTWDNYYDSLPVGYYIEGEARLELQLGDSALLDMIPVPKGAVRWQVTNTSSYSPSSYGLVLWKVNPATQELDTAIAYTMNVNSASNIVQDRIKNGDYYAQVTAYVSSRGTFIQKFLTGLGGALTIANVNDDTLDVSLTLTNDDTLGGTGKHATVKVRSLYTGPCSLGRVTHTLKENSGNFGNNITIGIDDSSTFDYVIPGWYTVSALIDTNHDGIIEAYTGETMLFVAPDSSYDLTQLLVDRVSGPGGISGTLAYTGSAFPSSCRIRVIAQLIDSTLADGDLAIDETNMAFNAYAVDLLSAPHAYSLEGLPEGQYIVFAQVDSAVHTPNWHLDTLEQGFYGVGTLVSRLYTRVRVEGGVTTGIDFNLGEPDAAVEKAVTPVRFALSQPSPNPFNPTVNLRFDVPAPSRVTLDVYDISGRHVVRLLDEVRSPGSHRITWAARNGNGGSIASGVYVVRMQSGRFIAKQKLVFLK